MTVLTTGPITKAPEWVQALSSVSWVNSVAISHRGDRVVGATFIHDYENKSKVFGQYTTVCFDGDGKKPLWTKPLAGWDGLFAVAISSDGAVAASGGLFTAPRADQLITGPGQTTGLLLIFDAANGNVLFDPSTVGAPIGDRVNIITLSADGDIVAAAADQLYVYKRNGGTYAPMTSSAPGGDPDFRTALGRVAAVAVHPGGQWFAACNDRGQLLIATIAGGAINRTFLVKVPDEPVNPAMPGTKAPVRFLSVIAAAESDAFVAGGSDVVYRSSLSDVLNGTPPVRYDASDGAAPVVDTATIVAAAAPPLARPNVRWTAISGDGRGLAAVANRIPSPNNGNSGGQLLIFDAQSAAPTVKVPLAHNPNGVSMDHSGAIIAVSDGYPVGRPGMFYRFDFNGNEMWRWETPNMNWPIAVSGNGSAIAAGGDDGRLYYFLP